MFSRSGAVRRSRCGSTATPDSVFHGVVDNISDAVDPQSLTLKVRVVLPNPGHRLKPQMYATVSVTDRSRNAIVVPATAVIRDGVTTYVFVQTGENKYVRRDVQVGDARDTTVEITERPERGRPRVSTGAELLRGAGVGIAMQGFIRALLRYRTIVLILFLAALAAGSFAFSQLDIEAYPDPSPPMVEFITQNPAWSAEEMEQQVTVPSKPG